MHITISYACIIVSSYIVTIAHTRTTVFILDVNFIKLLAIRLAKVFSVLYPCNSNMRNNHFQWSCEYHSISSAFLLRVQFFFSFFSLLLAVQFPRWLKISCWTNSIAGKFRIQISDRLLAFVRLLFDPRPGVDTHASNGSGWIKSRSRGAGSELWINYMRISHRIHMVRPLIKWYIVIN